MFKNVILSILKMFNMSTNGVLKGVFTMKLTLNSTINLSPLNIKKDQKHFIVEDVQTGEFYEMPQICIDAIQLIQQGYKLGEVESVLKNIYPDEDVDMIDFANQLLDLHLVKEINGQELSIQDSNVLKNGFKWITPRLGRFFFNRWSMYGYGLIFLMNILLFILKPQFLPSYKDIFVFDVMTLNILLWVVISFCTVMIHEFGHVLAARAYELPTQMSLGHRLFFVVFETDLSRALSLIPKDRNILYLAGMCLDQVILFAALIGQIFIPNGTFLAVVVLDVFIRTVFQCCFYMKTDVYYVFENLTGCYNLMENGKRFLRKWLPFIHADEETEAFTGEEKVVKFYALFYILGISITTLFFILFYIPQTIYALNQTIPHLILMKLDLYFWDSFLFVGQFCLMMGLLFYSWKKNRRIPEQS